MIICGTLLLLYYTKEIRLKMFTYTKISPKMVNPRDKVGNAEEDEDVKEILLYACFPCSEDQIDL